MVTAFEPTMPADQHKCRACGGMDVRRSLTAGEYRVMRCEACTHVFLDIAHTDDSIQRMYESYDVIGTDTYFSGIDAKVLANFDSYLNRCSECLPDTSGSPRLLDIGCGTGAFLERAQKAGFSCEGVELCRPLAEATRRNLECPVHVGLLSEMQFPDQSFDVITMYDLIEHLPDPASDLRRVHEWLRPGGVLFILTPNDDALLRRLARLIFHGSFQKVDRPVRTLYYPHHLSYFSVRSLTRLMSASGFEIARFETRNQEVSRLILSGTERLVVRLVFALAATMPSMGGKLVVWARKKPHYLS